MDQPTTLSPNRVPDGPTKTRSKSDRTIFQRIITGLAIGAFAIFIDFVPGFRLPEGLYGFPFALTIGIISIVAVSEFYGAVRLQGAEPSDPLGIITCVLFQLVAWHGGGRLDPFLPGFLTLIILAIMLVELVKPKQKPILNIGTTLLGCIYCGWLFSYIVLLHQTRLPLAVPVQGTTSGEWLVLFILCVTSGNDIGALFSGRGFGKHKMAPNISPSKTWEGALGGVIVASIVALCFAETLKIPLLWTTLIGAALAAVGLVGDLCESAMKRELGVKDFGAILPGHGGFLDRVDSILFIAPVGYYLLVLMLRA